MAGKRSRKRFVGFFLEEPPFRVEQDRSRCIHKIPSQIGCDQFGIEILPAARDEVFRCTALYRCEDTFEFFPQTRINTQIERDGAEPVADHLIQLLIRQMVLDVHLAGVQKIRDLAVLGESLPRCRHDNVPDVRIRIDDLPDLRQLDAVRDRGAAKLCYFHSHFFRFLLSFLLLAFMIR